MLLLFVLYSCSFALLKLLAIRRNRVSPPAPEGAYASARGFLSQSLPDFRESASLDSKTATDTPYREIESKTFVSKIPYQVWEISRE
jgi:hypothetical protein